MEILAYNYRCPFGEADLIAKEGETLIFVEVKYRASERYGNPLMAVNTAKQQRLCRVADDYRMRGKIPEDTPFRFDVVGILGEEIVHVPNAFEYRPRGR